jgi:hypothetical protein
MFDHGGSTSTVGELTTYLTGLLQDGMNPDVPLFVASNDLGGLALHITDADVTTVEHGWSRSPRVDNLKGGEVGAIGLNHIRALQLGYDVPSAKAQTVVVLFPCSDFREEFVDDEPTLRNWSRSREFADQLHETLCAHTRLELDGDTDSEQRLPRPGRSGVHATKGSCVGANVYLAARTPPALVRLTETVAGLLDERRDAHRTSAAVYDEPTQTWNTHIHVESSQTDPFLECLLLKD